MNWFPNEAHVCRYLERLRWPEGFVVRAVVRRHHRIGEPKPVMCSTCRAQCSVTAVTIFEKTRTPLRSWLAAVCT